MKSVIRTVTKRDDSNLKFSRASHRLPACGHAGFWGFLGGPRGFSKWVIGRVISTLNGVTLIITLLITDLLSLLGLQVGLGFEASGSGMRILGFGL